MVNEPSPHQLTVGRLKELLRQVPDLTVVAVKVPPLPPDGWPGARYLPFTVRPYEGGPVLMLEIETPSAP